MSVPYRGWRVRWLGAANDDRFLYACFEATSDECEFNRNEREVAVYLDGEEVLTWRHRNVPRTQYGIQGWKKGEQADTPCAASGMSRSPNPSISAGHPVTCGAARSTHFEPPH